MHDVIVFHPGGRRLFNSSWGRTELLDVQTSQPIVRFPETDCRAAVFSPDGHRLAIADGPAVRLYDATPRTDYPWGDPGPSPGKVWLGSARAGDRPMVWYIVFVLLLTTTLLVLVSVLSVRRWIRRRATKESGC
jgi:hypothetical protein